MMLATCNRGLVTIFAFTFLMSGCFYYPKKIEYYDEECEIQARKMVLKVDVMRDPCPGPASEACIAAVVGVSAGSAIVSGSIVVVGNTVYWLEKKGKCIAKSKT